jgi:predicted transcriptional regulator
MSTDRRPLQIKRAIQRAREARLLALPTPRQLRAIRELSGTTQREIAQMTAERSGEPVTRAAVAHYEAGRRSPRGERRLAYAEVLKELAGVRP